MGGTIDTLSVNRLMDRMIESFFPCEYAARVREADAEAAAAAVATASTASQTHDEAEIGSGNANSTESSSSSQASVGASTLLPLFVLDPTLPGQRIQLRVFEPRYLRMVDRSLRGTRRFGMVGFARYAEPFSPRVPLYTSTFTWGVCLTRPMQIESYFDAASQLSLPTSPRGQSENHVEGFF